MLLIATEMAEVGGVLGVAGQGRCLLHSFCLLLCLPGESCWRRQGLRLESSENGQPPLLPPASLQTKAQAAAAKAAGSKDQQKACGQLIGQLRQEMAQLGITDAELAAAAPSQHEPAPPQQQLAEAAAADGEAEAAAEKPAAEDGGEDGSRHSGGAAAAAAAEAAGSEGELEESEDEGLGFDLFGDGSALEGAEVVKSRKTRAQLVAAAAAAAAAAGVQPWGAAAGSKKKGKGGKAAPPPPKVEPQQPKALLQQHCQRCGWAAPRFERLTHGGMRLEGGGYRYSAAVAEASGAAKGPRRKQQQQQQAAGPRIFSLREEDDGWERIEVGVWVCGGVGAAFRLPYLTPLGTPLLPGDMCCLKAAIRPCIVLLCLPAAAPASQPPLPAIRAATGRPERRRHACPVGACLRRSGAAGGVAPAVGLAPAPLSGAVAAVGRGGGGRRGCHRGRFRRVGGSTRGVCATAAGPGRGSAGQRAAAGGSSGTGSGGRQ